MKSILNYIAARLQERSTWLGLIGLLGSIGITISPNDTDTIVTVGIALASALLAITSDKSTDKNSDNNAG